MDNNDKVKMDIIDRDDETNQVKIRINMTYGVRSLTKGEK